MIIIKLNKDILGKNINIVKNDGPLISYRYNTVEEVLKKYFCVKKNAYVLLGKVLSQFGYAKSDTIELTNMLYKDNRVVIDYEVNGSRNEYNKITIVFDKFIFKFNAFIG